MCHQSIFSFTKCHHTAQTLNICRQGTLAPPQPCRNAWEGVLFQSDAICKGCQAVILLQGGRKENGLWGVVIPKTVKGNHETMPYKYVVEGQLPWGPLWYAATAAAQKPPNASLADNSWKLGEGQASYLSSSSALGKLDTVTPVRKLSCQKAPSSPSSSRAKPPPASTPVAAPAPAAVPDPAPPALAKTSSAPAAAQQQQHTRQKSSTKRADEQQQLAPADQALAQPSRPKHRVHFLPTAEVQYFKQDTAANHIKRGDILRRGIQGG